jgi:predicted aldo/keto reductase-like oxidoreductase
MQYRDFGKLDWKVSALGFGAMRLPTTDGDTRSNNIDEYHAIRMIRHAIDEGVNYLDTAYIYHGGNSELLVGKALADGYRNKVRIATKSPTWFIRTEHDFDRILNEQLTKLRTDHIDFYLLHGLNEKSWHDVVLGKNLLERAERAISDGRIGHLGFSFHDAYKAFVEIVSGYDRWTFCQIQYNYMDIENQAGTRGLRLAAGKGLAVVVMEPLLGGRLANPPAPIRRIFDESGTKLAPVDLALQWIWDQPEVSTVLSGMSSMAQVKANISSACRSRLHSLQRSDLELVAKLRAQYRERTTIPCTKCNYCMPCPNGVDIPRNFELFNDAHMHEDFPEARFVYGTFVPESERAGNCIECQTCEELCPQKIPISEWMPKVAEALGTPTT